jgi:hypothetical protein
VTRSDALLILLWAACAAWEVACLRAGLPWWHGLLLALHLSNLALAARYAILGARLRRALSAQRALSRAQVRATAWAAVFAAREVHGSPSAQAAARSGLLRALEALHVARSSVAALDAQGVRP